jgi:hypothetical protein
MLLVSMDILHLNMAGIAGVIITLFLIFFGIGLIIPNSLSHALKPYNNMAGTAGSIFGACYYSIIAMCTGIMSLLHNGTAFPFSIYITFLGILIICGSRMIRSPQYRTTKKMHVM